MEDNREAIEKTNEEVIETKAEETKPAADNVTDDDIQYTFVVPKGEVYREPEVTAEGGPEETVEGEPEETIPEPVIIEPEPEKTIVADHRSFTEAVNNALEDAAEADAGDEFFESYKAADPKGRTTFIEPPIYDATGLPYDDDITYTFVVPKGEIYKEPDPEEERAAKEAERAKRAIARAAREIPPGSTEILPTIREWASLPINRKSAGSTSRERKTASGHASTC